MMRQRRTLSGRFGLGRVVRAGGGGAGPGGDLAELLVHRLDQEDQGDGQGREDEEPEDPGGHLAAGWDRGGDGPVYGGCHRLTLSRTPANRAASGSSLSTTDLAR